MSNKIPTNQTTKVGAVADDSMYGYDSVAVDNKMITVQAIGDFAMSDNDTDALAEGATNKYATTTNVDAAGATMNTDTDLSSNGYFLDEDDLNSDDATKVASQQSIKAYVDNLGVPINSQTPETTIDDADEFIFYDDSATSNKKITKANLLNGYGAIEPGTTNTYLSANTERTSSSDTYTKIKEFTTNRSGTFQVNFDLSASLMAASTVYARVYINDVAVGTEQSSSSTTYATHTENFQVKYGDLVQLYYRSNTGTNALVRNFDMKYDLIDAVTAGSVDLD